MCPNGRNHVPDVADFKTRNIGGGFLNVIVRLNEWNLMCHSEPNRGFLQTLEDGFAELREKYLDNDGYKLRPLLEDEVAQFPNIDEDYCVSKVIPN